MLKNIADRIRRIVSPDLHLKGNYESTIPTNLEEYYLATLDLMYNKRSPTGGARLDQMLNAMTVELNGGVRYPDVTLKDDPTKFYLDRKYHEWVSLVEVNHEWFSDAMAQLLGIITDYVEEYQLQPKQYDRHREKIKLYQRTIFEVASGFCGDITIRNMTDDDRQHYRPVSEVEHKPLEAHKYDCVVSVEFQGEHWVFFMYKGRVCVPANNKTYSDQDRLASNITIKTHCENMIKTIAIMSVGNWVTTKRLAELNDDPLFKDSAIKISKVTQAPYHQHLLEIDQLTASEELNWRYIKRFYEVEYNIYYPMYKLIEEVYEDFFQKSKD